MGDFITPNIQRRKRNGGIMKRQGMVVTVKQLRKLADDLLFELLNNNPKGFFKTQSQAEKQGIQINIINKSKHNESDTWEIEA